ncbi:hypothetical protein CCACVL1_28106 [Corchorus capsularis]|uniref:DUF4283 domain-containing protein n=1 Tax=Corchorus capsularis TaxID=210143 RepID=A0A1R3G7H7_COCAP|nr:hypothetical protein CCACVL1_28106 [Corchorus capsularis]
MAGKLISERAVNRGGVKNILRRAWMEFGEVKIADAPENIFVFSVRNEEVMNQILQECPWSAMEDTQPVTGVRGRDARESFKQFWRVGWKGDETRKPRGGLREKNRGEKEALHNNLITNPDVDIRTEDGEVGICQLLKDKAQVSSQNPDVMIGPAISKVVEVDKVQSSEKGAETSRNKRYVLRKPASIAVHEISDENGLSGTEAKLAEDNNITTGTPIVSTAVSFAEKSSVSDTGLTADMRAMLLKRARDVELQSIDDMDICYEKRHRQSEEEPEQSTTSQEVRSLTIMG